MQDQAQPSQTGPRPAVLPARPRAVLRIGFAGRRELEPAEEARLEEALVRVFTLLGHRLAALTPGVPVVDAAVTKVADFFATGEPPLLRVVTGLCEGADAAAARALEQVCIRPNDGSDAPPEACLARRLAAVLPFAVDAYRTSRKQDFRDEFDAQAARCEYIQVLDGRWEKPEDGPDFDPDDPLDKARRNLGRRRRRKGYRAQSALLLRHADLLVAAADPDAEGKAGGTLETMARALAFELPVLFVHTGDCSVRLVEPDMSLDTALGEAPIPEDDLPAVLGRLVSGLVAGPDLPQATIDGAAPHAAAPGRGLLTEYFRGADLPPRRRWGPRRGERRVGFREFCWNAFRRRFEDLPHDRPRGLAHWLGLTAAGGPRQAVCTSDFDEASSPFFPYRDRARQLNYHHGGRYRGAFVLAYALTVLAVLLASLSLVVLGMANDEHEQSDTAKLIQTLGSPAATAPDAAAAMPRDSGAGGDDPDRRRRLLWLLIALAAAKLATVMILAHNTRQANAGRWNDFAVDYRYLAERLRTMTYLPLAGSLKPPAAAPQGYASRATRQSAVDWLFDAIVRSVDPTVFCRRETLPTHDGRGKLELCVWRPDPLRALDILRRDWTAGQVAYHAKNAGTMHRIEAFTDVLGRGVGLAVILIVVLDLALVGAKVSGWLPPWGQGLERLAAPWLMVLAALLPAAVAALSGLKFQSECHRLAERSEHLRRLLGGPPPPRPDPAVAPGLGEPLRRAIARRRQPRHLVQTTTHPAHGRHAGVTRLAARAANCRAAADDDIGGWTLETLHAAERIAGDTVQEVAEWSVLYSKEVPDT
ncbi:hypothetical protein [uncultured Thiohalocapsa sp.]|uniref:hypothetical protein n=1 Tax=uncultured Thiohalocapsa sp. TaxID=768990 RepID=UPI0025EBC685|nr:hypothetical protein [uncultured Thiohalocapsa sp.]